MCLCGVLLMPPLPSLLLPGSSSPLLCLCSQHHNCLPASSSSPSIISLYHQLILKSKTELRRGTWHFAFGLGTGQEQVGVFLFERDGGDGWDGDHIDTLPTSFLLPPCLLSISSLTSSYMSQLLSSSHENQSHCLVGDLFSRSLHGMA